MFPVSGSSRYAASASRMPALFRGRGGLAAVLAGLNALPAPLPEHRYVSRHYAPRSTGTADWRTERLFYTTENALAIDAMRWRIAQQDELPVAPQLVMIGPEGIELLLHQIREWPARVNFPIRGS